MGIAIGNAQWSYGGFSHFRQRLARHEGFELDAMFGFGGDQPWDAVATDLRPLLDHSDCDGELTADECSQVFPRLAVILDEWATRPEGDPALDYDVRAGRVLVEEMRKAASYGTRLEFR